MNKHLCFSLPLLMVLLSLSLSAKEPEKDKVELDEDGNPIPVIVYDSAPSWSLEDAEGQIVSSEQLAGKAYVLHFWATWNPYSEALQPALDVMAMQYRQQDIATYAVSYWENPRARPARVMAMRGLSLPVLIKGDKVAKDFAVQGVPVTIFVNHKNEIMYRYLKSDPHDPQIRAAYEMLVDAKQQEIEAELAAKALEAEENQSKN